MAETRIPGGSEGQPEQGQIIHNSGVPGSSPGVATNKFKGLASARPFLFLPVAMKLPLSCPSRFQFEQGATDSER